MAIPGVDIVKAFVVNQSVNHTVRTYFVLATALGYKQWCARQSTFNYWFGKIEMERRIERNQL